MPLDEIRKTIDAIDTQLLDLLSKRADAVHMVGEIKKNEDLEIYAPEREDALLKSLASKNQGRLPEKSFRAIYPEIMSAAPAHEDDRKHTTLRPA